jgi:hypothetical protein
MWCALVQEDNEVACRALREDLEQQQLQGYEAPVGIQYQNGS